MEALLRKRLLQARRTLQQALFWKRAGWWSLALFTFVALSWWNARGKSTAATGLPAALICLWGTGLVGLRMYARRQFLDWHELALKVESRFPDLQLSLVTAAQSLKEREAKGAAPASYLQRVVWQQALEHAQNTNWLAATDVSTIHRGRLATLSTLATAIGLVTFQLLSGQVGPQAELVAKDDASQSRATISVDPGNTEVERGTSLVVSARFEGMLPARPVLVRQLPDGTSDRFELKQRLEDPLFAVQLLDVQQPFRYRIEFEGQASDEFQIEVFEYPQMVQADAQLTYPEYTKQPVKQIANTRRVSVVEGTQVDWHLHLNKPVIRAWLEDEDGQTVQLSPDKANSQTFHANVIPAKDRRWSVHLVDERQRTNQNSTDLFAQVLVNRLPTIKAQVRGDREASPLEEVPVRATFWDDYGLTRYGFEFSLGASLSQEVVLGSDQAGGQNAVGESMMDFEQLGAKPDDLVAYHFWAEDVDASGAARRVTSDLYFIEVRQFEEIFRQGEQPGGEQAASQSSQGAAGGSPSTNLLQLQKQILTGTWNLLRRQSSRVDTAKYPEDLQMLRESQEKAHSDLREVATRGDDPRLSVILYQIKQAMDEAIAELKLAEDPAKNSLSNAVAAEQRSYQGLLQLREHEHQVIRRNRSSSAAPGQQARNGPMQQQLQELQLEEDINRYESERQAAQPADTPEERERRQIQSRLQDLARRQEDVNQEMANLQNELQLSPEEKKKQEAEELRLKRLREHQQELMDEADELVERMDRAADPQNWQQTRQQVQESRERMQQSQESAEQGQTGQALAAGTRAQQQLRETADQLRQQSATQFQEQIESLTSNAMQIEQQQKQLTEQLRESTNSRSPGLRANASNQQIQDQIDQQKKSLEELSKQLQETIQNAESSEPLLARQLYDVYQQSEKDGIPQKLDATKQQVELEQREQATETSQSIASNLSTLREGIQRTGRDVLGSDLEAWRRASDELERLTEALRAGQPREGEEGRESSGKSQSNQVAQREASSEDNSAGEEDGRSTSDRLNELSRNEQEGDRAENPRSDESPTDEQRQGESPEAGETASNENSGSPSASPEGQPSPSGQPGQGAPSDQSQESNNQGIASSNQPPRPGERSRASGQSGGPANEETGRGGTGTDSPWDATRALNTLTGPTSEEWIDRLRDVEEVLDDAEFRSRAAQIRDRVREIRRESRRHSKEPQWSLVEELVASPLEELRDAVAEEVLRRSGERNTLVPIDRDPVPGPFTERVREYYERLGTGQ